MKSNKFALLLVLTLVCASFQKGRAESAQASDDKKITFRALVGPAFYSGTDPIARGTAFGADLDMQVSGNFGMGVAFTYGSGTGSSSSGATSTDYSQSTSTFGLRGFYKVTRGAVTASIGPIIGVISNSSSTKVYATGSSIYNPATSATQFGLGFGASIDVAIIGPLALTISPSVMQGIGSAPNMTVINVLGGLSFNF